MRPIPILLVLLALVSSIFAQTRDYTRWVNPFIGTGGHGHTFPGATMPFGMVQLSPDTRIDNWDGSSGYHYSDDVIYGFSHTHLSGTGIPDGCDILLLPTIDDNKRFTTSPPLSIGSYERIRASDFSHSDEKAEPGYYSVRIDNSKLLVELTATTRVGLHRYTFPRSEDAGIHLNLAWRDKTLATKLTVVNNSRIEGYRRSSSWAKDQAIYFVAEFSRPFLGAGDERAASGSMDEEGQQEDIFLPYTTKERDQILVKVAISHVSIEGARKNLEAELPHWDFDKVRADAKAAWNKELSKIDVSGGTDEQTTNFYSALYHTMIHPNVFNDVDGNYRGHDGKTHNINRRDAEAQRGKEEKGIGSKNSASPRLRGESSEQYTVFSLWDTFRAAHPLYTIIDQKRTVDYINTFLRIYEQGGRLPVWGLWGEETDTMIGYHSVSVIADAMAKGIEGFDYEKAYAAAKHSANLDHHGLAAYKKRGYVSGEDDNESVSKTLEYAYNDWCIAQMAKILLAKRERDNRDPRILRQRAGWDDPYRRETTYHLDEERRVLLHRARFFENLFDPETRFFRPKRNGSFVKPFAPNEVTFHFTEGNSWQYSFFAPHDVTRLIALMGGREKFVAKLDELFTTEQKLTGREQPDITGLIGQYAHGNEPSHHIPYLYNYAGAPSKTQARVRYILDNFYKNSPDGLIGNEDCGQMSAWYVLSASGFYSTTPGQTSYDLGTPIFREVKFNLENGKTFTVRAPNVSGKNFFVSSVKRNGRTHRSSFIRHEDMMKGGVLEFGMTDRPNDKAFTDYSRTAILQETVAVPIIEGERVFRDKATIVIKAPLGGKIHWKQEGSTATQDWRTDAASFEITETTTVRAYAVDAKGGKSPEVEAVFAKRPNNWTVKLLSEFNSQYPGSSYDAIIDGLRGNHNFAAGEWQGYWGKPFEAIIDLQRETEIREVGGSFLQSARSWIWMPDRLEFEVSNDGASFTKIADWNLGFPQTEMNGTPKEFLKSVTPVKARYVRVRAHNFGKIPSWHLGAGGDPWIFVDEIFIR